MSRHPDKAASQRQLRVGEALRHALARILGRGQLRDPDLAGVTITVTEVRVGPDLSNATVFVVPLGGQGLTVTVAALNRAAGFLRGALGAEIVLRRLPRLVFEGDSSFDRAARIETLLTQPRVRRDLSDEAADGGQPESGDGA